MYAYVKFVSDGKTACVPDYFIKKFSGEYNSASKYEVFWSPRDEDTPEGIEQQHGQVINIDQITNVKQKTSLNGKAGYYFAHIIMIGENEEVLTNLVESKHSRKFLKYKVENDDVEKHDNLKKKGKCQDLIKKGTRMTQQLLEENLKTSSKKRKLADPGSIGLDEQELNEKGNSLSVNFWREKYLKCKARKKKLQNENEVLLERNLKLQEALISRLYESNNMPLPLHTVETSSTNLSSAVTENPAVISAVTENPAVISAVTENPAIISAVTENLDTHKAVLVSDVKPAPTVQTENCCQETDIVAEKYLLQESKIIGESKQDFLTAQQKTFALKNVHPGAKGDSVYCKNLALAIFGREVLMNSSVLGAQCPSKPEAAVKPPLCPEKMAYLKELFLYRVVSDPESELDVQKRLSKVNKYVSEKIMGLIRFSKK